MAPHYKTLSPQEAWKPLPAAEWNRDNAAHLLRRMAFSAEHAQTELALKAGLAATLEEAFGGSLSMEEPNKIGMFREMAPGRMRAMQDLPEEERREIRQQLQREGRQAVADYGVQYYQHIREPARQPFEKWVMFLQDVLVIGVPKVRNAPELYNYQETLRAKGLGPYPELCKTISREPGMVRYLDLQQNVKGKPNENFARELFELFTLGEGNYTEQDIKEAARAFTGYKANRTGEFYMARHQRDAGPKTVFGVTGDHSGDDVIDITFRQPAAAVFLPREMLSFYLSADTELEDAYVEELGRIWKESGYDLGLLARTFFGSRLFFHGQFRGNYIKSPAQFYIGMLSDLHLDVPPFPGYLNNNLRSMGQPFYQPPNVRGWVYGKHWINSTTLAARRQAVQWVFTPLKEGSLNGDDRAKLMEERAAGRGRIKVDDEQMEKILAMSDRDIVESMLRNLYPGDASPAHRKHLMQHLAQGKGGRNQRVRLLLITLLQAPEYHLC